MDTSNSTRRFAGLNTRPGAAAYYYARKKRRARVDSEGSGGEAGDGQMNFEEPGDSGLLAVLLEGGLF